MADSTDLTFRLLGQDVSASRSLERVGGSFRKLGGYIGGEFGEILSRVGEGFEHVGEHGTQSIAKLTTAVGAAGAGIGAALMTMGSGEQQASAQLKTAFADVGVSMSDYQEEIEKSVKANEKFGQSGESTKQALATLVTATGDPKKALESMGLVADIAGKKHIGLNDAAALVAKGLNGNAKFFKQFGITVGTTGDKSKNLDKALDLVSKRIKGQASANVAGFTGKLKVLRTELGDGAAEFGAKYGGAITMASTGLMALGMIMQSTIVQTVALKVASLATAAAQKVWAAAQWLLNAALDANPIALIIIAIVALVAAIVIAYKHSATFRAIVQAAMHAVGEAFKWLWNAAKVALDAIGKAWDWLWSHVIKYVIDLIVGYFKMWIAIVRGTINVIVGIFRWLANVFLTIVGTIIDAAARAFGWIPGLGPKLRDAAAKFKTFKDQVNAALGGLKSKTITVTAKYAASGTYYTGNKWTKAMASGGVLDGYTPGRDVHIFTSPTGGSLALSGGEAIMRPEFTRAMGGSAGIARLNKLAMHGMVGDVGNIGGYAGGGVIGTMSQRANILMALAGSGSIGLSGRGFSSISAFDAKMQANQLRGFASAMSGGPVFERIRAWVMSHLGIPYLWGGTGPRYDCSGFTQAALAAAGIHSPRTARQQQAWARSVNGALRPGDLGFLGYPAHHVEMYMGNGLWAQEPHTGASSYISRQSGFTSYGRAFDSGGWLMPGHTLAFNGTGRPERVLGPGESRGLHIHVHTPAVVTSDRDLIRLIDQAYARTKGQYVR